MLRSLVPPFPFNCLCRLTYDLNKTGWVFIFYPAQIGLKPTTLPTRRQEKKKNTHQSVITIQCLHI